VKIYFVTVNEFKFQEAKDYLRGSKVELERVNYQIREILDLNLEVIVRDKCLKAYEQAHVPCVVEHGGVGIDALKGLPGGLSKVVWDNLGDQLCKLIPRDESRSAKATSVIGYCDGKRIKLYKGVTEGEIVTQARGDYKFQWDPIFSPKGETRTYAELGREGKRRYSQAAQAWTALAKDLGAEK
jgi:XTP/dITP diphosphohydrolase